MKVGVLLPVTGQQATKENISHVAEEAENEGLDSLGFRKTLGTFESSDTIPRDS
jgi:hypothetical protein